MAGYLEEKDLTDATESINYPFSKSETLTEYLKELEPTIACVRQQIQEKEKELADLDLKLKTPGFINSAKTLSSLTEEADELRSALERDRAMLARMDQDYKRVAQEIIHAKHFDKTLFLQNLRELLKHSDVRIGQIEKEAGIQTGYISRLEKSGNTTDPTAEFIVTAAEMLGVPIDLLVNSKIGSISETEKTLLDFFQSLILDTRSDKIIWKKEAEPDQKPLDETGIKATTLNSRASHPLFSREIISDQQGVRVRSSRYQSSFFPENKITCGSCYRSLLPYGNTKVYITKCFSSDNLENAPPVFYEIYLIRSDTKKDPICCTAKCPDMLKNIINSLYIEIQAAESHAHLNQETLMTISEYLLHRADDHK